MMSGSEDNRKKRTPKFENCRQIFERVIVRIESRTEKPDFVWGIPHLDFLTHGINRGKTTIIAARTSEGKTTLGIHTAVRNAGAGKIVAYISLEDDREQLVEKVFCCLTGTNNQDIKRGRADIKQLLHDPEIHEMMERMPLLVMDNFGYRFDEVEALITDLNPKPDLVIIDYIQMVEGNDPATDKRREAISEFARQIQKLAIRENIGIVLVSQINRKGAEDGRPRLHHLAESGTLEQVADVVLMMYLPNKYNDSSYDYQFMKDGKKIIVTHGMDICPPDYLELEVAKNKTGPIGVAVARFDKTCYQIKDYGNINEARSYVD